MAKASPSLEYFRLPFTGHFDSLSTTSPSQIRFYHSGATGASVNIGGGPPELERRIAAMQTL